MTEFPRGIRRKNAHYICRFDDTNFWGNSAKKCFSCYLKTSQWIHFLKKCYFSCILFSRISAKISFFSTNIVRWCACSVCEQWRKWNGVLFKVVLPAHKDPCSCTCPFCDSDCCSIERISPRYMMEHLLCPPSRQFALSSVSLYSWDCIYNRFTISSAALDQPTLSCTTYLSRSVIRCNHQNCFSKRQGSLFTCPKNDMFSEQGLVE